MFGFGASYIRGLTVLTHRRTYSYSDTYVLHDNITGWLSMASLKARCSRLYIQYRYVTRYKSMLYILPHTYCYTLYTLYITTHIHTITDQLKNALHKYYRPSLCRIYVKITHINWNVVHLKTARRGTKLRCIALRHCSHDICDLTRSDQHHRDNLPFEKFSRFGHVGKLIISNVDPIDDGGFGRSNDFSVSLMCDAIKAASFRF